MSEQHLRPSKRDRNSWVAYWKSCGQPWRREPEIGIKRQLFLTKKRAITPEINNGIYPFGGVKLTRADVEWLLATHESNGINGPVEIDKAEPQREGLDLRGAILDSVDLSFLPLTKLRGGFTDEESLKVPFEIRIANPIHLERANLHGAQLEYAELARAELGKAYLFGAHLEGANFRNAHMEGADLTESHLKGTNLRGAYFSIANEVDRAAFDGAKVSSLHWGEVNLAIVDWNRVVLGDEYEAKESRTPDGKLKNRVTRLDEFDRAVRATRRLAIVLRAQGLNEQADRFSYRAQAYQRSVLLRRFKLPQWLFSWILFFLAGYGYRPIRTLLWYLFVIITFAWGYFQVSHGDFLFGITTPSGVRPLQWYEALVLSVSSFHGRGFFQPLQNPGDPVAILAAVEAVLGLFIEISFIATFTQRYFGTK